MTRHHHHATRGRPRRPDGPAQEQDPPERRYITVAEVFGASDKGETIRIPLVIDAEEAGL